MLEIFLWSVGSDSNEDLGSDGYFKHSILAYNYTQILEINIDRITVSVLRR